MIEKLERLVDEVGTLQTKLVLLVGPPGVGKTTLLHTLGNRKAVKALNVGAELGRSLSQLTQKQRQLKSPDALRELIGQHARGDLVLLDNIELLFDRTLRLNPLDLLKRHAHTKCVVAVWPGELHGDARTGRLVYAALGHPEHQDYSLAGVVLFEIKQ